MVHKRIFLYLRRYFLGAYEFHMKSYYNKKSHDKERISTDHTKNMKRKRKRLSKQKMKFGQKEHRSLIETF